MARRSNDKTESRPEYDLRDDDRLTRDLYAADAGRSNFAAFLLGGVVIAGGLLAFLYYDSENMSGRDVLTTGSITRIERQGTIGIAPARPPATAPSPVR